MAGRIIVSAVGLAILATSGAAPAGEPGGPRCGPPAKAPGPTAEAAPGRGLAAVARGGIVTVTGRGAVGAVPGTGPLGQEDPPGVLRHAASRPGAGLAYVNDLPGPDVLTMMGPAGVEEIRRPAEITHPALGPDGAVAWAADLRALEVRGADGRIRSYSPPGGASAVFSPAFRGRDELVAVVQQAQEGTHDDGLNDLWRLDLSTGSWTRLTSFRADADRWSVIRTPVVAPDGSVLFVRVAGVASATEPPRFELWRVADGEPARVRELPGEAYLAGILEGRLVWNVDEDGTGRWRLVMEGAEGPVDLGCGAVMVDPRAELDPDLLPPDDEDGEEAPAGPQEADPGGRGMAILVGDFASREEARHAAARLDAPLVVGHDDAPGAVGPGAWAVAWPVPPTSRPDEMLDGLRSRFPWVAERSWVVALQPAAGEGE